MGRASLRGRSHCDACGHVLAPRDLVPVVSYPGFTTDAAATAGPSSPGVTLWAEAVSALVFVTLLLHYDISLQALEGLRAWPACCWSAPFADLEGYIIPDRFIAVGVVLFIITLFFAPASRSGGRWTAPSAVWRWRRCVLLLVLVNGEAAGP